jgi:ABC-type protease/lipase transport system fused ATPase/permease subunit
MILAMPQGYNSRVGRGGLALSAASASASRSLARCTAISFLVVLDEPNSNLDQDGDTALAAAIEPISARIGIVVVSAGTGRSVEARRACRARFVAVWKARFAVTVGQLGPC